MYNDVLSSHVDILSSYISKLTFSDIPADTVFKTKIHIADTLGAALAGTKSGEYAVAKQVLNNSGSTCLWGSEKSANARDAAILNGIAAHAFELDDSGGCDHSGAVVIPALFASLSTNCRPISGKQLITAVSAGYEVGRRVLEAAGGYDTHNKLGWHSTGTCGTMGAAAAVANLNQYNKHQTRDAITLATSFSSGLWAFIHDGSQAKKLHAGRAAEGGLLAAQLAFQGYAGPSQVFEDVWGGFFNAYNKIPSQPELLIYDLGSTWKINRAVIKPYASCRGAHSAVDALQDILLELNQTPENLLRITVKLSPMLNAMCGNKAFGTMAAAQMSLPYALAAHCAFGTAGLQAYTHECRFSAPIQQFLNKIELIQDGNMNALDEPLICCTFTNGVTVEKHVPRATGSAERPMQLEHIGAKFKELANMALSAEQTDKLWSMILNLEELDDARLVEKVLVVDSDFRPSFR